MKILAILVDTMLVSGGFVFSFWLRYPHQRLYSEFFRNNIYSLPFLVLICIMSMILKGCYQSRFKSIFDIAKNTFLSLGLAMFVGMSFIYVFRTRWLTFPSGIFLLTFPIIFTSVSAVNILLYKIFGRVYRRIEFISGKEIRNIESLLRKDLDELVITSTSLGFQELSFLIKISEMKKAKLSILPEIYDRLIFHKLSSKDTMYLLPAYFKNHPEESILRAFDSFIALLFLFAFFPLIALLAVLIKIDSSGPVIFKQKRVGRHGRVFTLYKFRSMVEDAGEYSRPEWLPLFDDPRVTKIGKLMRKARLDELPQLFNILRGDMSLVGPRPEAVYRVRQHRSLQSIRLSIKPGLTGFAQIEGNYHLNPRHKLRYDYLYIKNRSLFFNMEIMLKTLPVVLFKSGS